MSLKNKLDLAFKKGVATERGRVLWLINQERQWLRKQLDEVILVEAQRHAMQTKVKMAAAIFTQLEMKIASGAGLEPKPVPKEEPDA